MGPWRPGCPMRSSQSRSISDCSWLTESFNKKAADTCRSCCCNLTTSWLSFSSISSWAMSLSWSVPAAVWPADRIISLQLLTTGLVTKTPHEIYCQPFTFGQDALQLLLHQPPALNHSSSQVLAKRRFSFLQLFLSILGNIQKLWQPQKRSVTFTPGYVLFSIRHVSSIIVKKACPDCL